MSNITDKIGEFTSGRLSREALVRYLTEEARYTPKPENPYTPGTPEWFEWADNRTIVSGSFDEVKLAYFTGEIPEDVYDEIRGVFYPRMRRRRD